MLVHHADARGDSGGGITGGKGLAKGFDVTLVSHIVTEQDVHERCLARAIFAKQGQYLAAVQCKRNIAIGGERAETLGDMRQAQDNVLRLAAIWFRHRDYVDLGSASLMVTSKEPALMASSRSFTLAMISAGTLPSNVPSGAMEQPPFFMKENRP